MAGLEIAHGLWRGAGAMTVGLVTGVAVVACGTGVGTTMPPTPDKAVSAAAATAAQNTAKPAKSVPYSLYTHCGINWVRVGGKYYTAVRALSDGSGNPPPGWANPYQAGTITLVSPTEVVFSDKAGHRVVFTTARQHAKSVMDVCA